MRTSLIFLSFVFSLTSCSIKPVEVAIITIKGSDSMLQLAEHLAEEYMKLNPGISIYVYGGGTTEGVNALIRNEIDICTASRNLRPQEAKALADYYSTVGLFYLVAKDALCVYVNLENPIKQLTSEQLKNIFECKITNWKELGGKEQKILPVIRNLNSGTHYYFKEHVLEGDEYCSEAVIEATTAGVIEYIENHSGAIGYGSIGYRGDVAYVSVDGVEPSEKTAQNDTYPITRYLHFFTSKLPKGSVKNFIDWVLSPGGQKVVKQAGFISLWELPPI